MLFRLSDNTPRFEVFRLLNDELLYFLEHAVIEDKFNRSLFTNGDVGQACWDNIKTKNEFEGVFNTLTGAGIHIKKLLFETVRDHQDFQALFESPKKNLLFFMTQPCKESLKSLCTHLYCSTKDLTPIVMAAGGINIKAHFNAYRDMAVNGNVCKACGMKELASFRAEIPDGDQWRSDYDHQLCKSKYPIFAVHPDNLIPLCDVCNQDAKKSKDLFRSADGVDRLAFYPYSEEAKDSVSIEIDNLHDPEPVIKVKWNTQGYDFLNKLKTWDEIYEIRSRVEGRFRSLEELIADEIDPIDSEHLENRIRDEARPVNINTLKRREWAFWYQKLFAELDRIDNAPFIAKWEFVRQQGDEGGRFIIEQQ